MIILDENFREEQRQHLLSWRVHVQQIGLDVGRDGMKDEAIIPLLHQLRYPTFFTLDADFFKRRLCHRNYCLVYLDVAASRAAIFVRRFLRHSQFNTQVKRVGTVVHASYIGLTILRLHEETTLELPWDKEQR